MTLRYEFHPAAEAEFHQTIEYYRDANPDLATAFVDEVASAIEFITAYPEGSLAVSTRARPKTVRRFPYSVLYSVRPEQIRIPAVMHQRRRPHYWIDRE